VEEVIEGEDNSTFEIYLRLYAVKKNLGGAKIQGVEAGKVDLTLS
jgi:hypothetical protein